MNKCKICGFAGKTNRGLSRHLRWSHDMSRPDYEIHFSFGGKQPICASPCCDNAVAFQGGSFNTFCSPTCKGFKTDLLFQWSANSAYMIGYFIGDGGYDKYLNQHRGVYWYSNDRQILLDMKSWIGRPGDLPCRKRSDRCNPSYKLGWSDARLFEYFNQTLGIPVAKKFQDGTYFVFELIPQDFHGDFLRGLIDSDGHIVPTIYDGLVIGFTVKQLSLKQAFIQFLSRYEIELTITDKSVLVGDREHTATMLKMMYPGGKNIGPDSLYLQRKYIRACASKCHDDDFNPVPTKGEYYLDFYNGEFQSLARGGMAWAEIEKYANNHHQFGEKYGGGFKWRGFAKMIYRNQLPSLQDLQRVGSV